MFGLHCYLANVLCHTLPLSVCFVRLYLKHRVKIFTEVCSLAFLTYVIMFFIVVFAIREVYGFTYFCANAQVTPVLSVCICFPVDDLFLRLLTRDLVSGECMLKNDPPCISRQGWLFLQKSYSTHIFHKRQKDLEKV